MGTAAFTTIGASKRKRPFIPEPLTPYPHVCHHQGNDAFID